MNKSLFGRSPIRKRHRQERRKPLTPKGGTALCDELRKFLARPAKESSYSSLAEIYNFCGAPAKGFSFSSVVACLRVAAQLIREGGNPDPDEVIRLAWAEERARAGEWLGGQDVGTVVFGGVVEIHTAPPTDSVSMPRLRSVSLPRQAQEWLQNHLVIAYNPEGAKHSVPALLATLFHHPERHRYVSKISKLASEASFALQNSDLGGLAEAITQYRNIFATWAGKGTVNPVVVRIAQDLEEQLGRALAGWKFPGAGAAEAIVVLVADPEAAAFTNQYFEKRNWVVPPVSITGGLEVRRLRNAKVASVGARVDLIGAADLGVGFGTPGTCLAAAIEPRSRVVILSGRTSPICDGAVRD